VLSGAGIGGMVGVRTADDAVKQEAQAKPLTPDQQLPFARPLPEIPGAKKRQPPVQPPAVEGGHAQKHGPKKKFTDLSDEGEHIVKCAVMGAAVGAGAEFLLRSNSKATAEAGATQNDEERVRWERQQEIRRQMDERYRKDRERGEE
jgi:hypothetical protein